MQSPDTLHDAAMLRVDEALAARKRGDKTESRDHFAAALALELEALALERNPAWRSVLTRSAAHLAVDAGELPEAVRIAEEGLANPSTSPRIRGELEELIRAVTGAAP